MKLYQKEIDVPKSNLDGSFVEYFEKHANHGSAATEIPIRFAVTNTSNERYKCELSMLEGVGDYYSTSLTGSIFKLKKRVYENTDTFNAVLIIPTGIGAELGGHSGDGGSLARLMASACDKLITHPNVVNASDINELPENGIYVEGSVITRLLMGTVGLQPSRSNRIMLLMDYRKDRRLSNLTINTASAARTAMGIEIPLIVELEQPFKMTSTYSSSGCAVGEIEGLEKLCELFEKYTGQFDAVALHTGIDVPKEYHLKYLKSHGEMVNPWGGVEAMLTHALTMMYDTPTAHAPMVSDIEIAHLHGGIVDPRIASEAISSTFLFSVLKGLHKSPRIICDENAFSRTGVLTNSEVSCLIIPDGCVGLPTLAAMEQGIPTIAVRENKNRMRNNLEDYPFQDGKLHIVENYLEAVGLMNALKAGVTPSSVRRPFADTIVIRGGENGIEQEVDNTNDLSNVIKLSSD